MEKIIFRVVQQEPEAKLRQHNQYIENLKKLSFLGAHQKIAEDRFRKPIEIFDRWAIRPFWRDWRKTAPLPRGLIKQIVALDMADYRLQSLIKK